MDGDTLRVKINGQSEYVCLIGVDTPEKGRCYAKEAADSLKPMLDKEVELESDKSQGDKDRYGRLLRYIHWNGHNVNQWLIENGFAKEYTYNKPYRYQSKFQEAEGRARVKGSGLWQCKL